MTRFVVHVSEMSDFFFFGKVAFENFKTHQKSQSAISFVLVFAHEIGMQRAQSPIGRIRGEANTKPLFEGVRFSLKQLLDKALEESVP